MNKTKGFRGYIGSREYNNYNSPHHVQNLVIRDYCQRNSLVYLLSVTEYSMPGSYVMLEEILRELSDLNGIVLHSIFMLPEDKNHRERLCKDILDKNNIIHGALENLCIDDMEALQKVEDIIEINTLMKKHKSIKLQEIDSEILDRPWE
jgi:sporadic carbohydrate cluster protein (TIGR04323 family)